MSIKSDRWIRERSTGPAPMIEPFEPGQVRAAADGSRIVSYGTSSYGYDVRCADEFKVFTNINSTIVDPKAFDEASFVDVSGPTCLIPPNSFALARTVEYFRIPRDVLTVCLGKSTYARCFSGDTRVALAGGTSRSFEEMVRGAEGGERFFGYGLGAFGRVEVVELEAPRLIGRDPLLELTLDDGATIRATPDHEFVLRDGTMATAEELRPGSSLMPLYRSLRRGHEMTYQPVTGHVVPTRRLAHERNLRRGIRHDGFDPRAHGPAIREVASASGDGTMLNHEVAAVRALPGEHDVYCLTAPETGNFALEAGVFVANCGLIVNVTPLEPEWEGHVTLEFSNTTPLPARIYANEGVAQMLFFQGDETCETSYADRAGKYQGQRGVTLPRT